MKQLNVVVTSGGTREYIDDVRVLTNISSGRLGSMIANTFIVTGHDVSYVSPITAIQPNNRPKQAVMIKGTNDLMQVMETLVPKADVVIHSMAVSDFTFDLKEATKISSNTTDAFVEHIRKTIRKTPKVISNFRKWNPDAILIGFKFTVGKSDDELHKIALDLMEKNDLDMVLANDKQEMIEQEAHWGRLIIKDEPLYDVLTDKEKIARGIYNRVMKLADKKGISASE